MIVGTAGHIDHGKTSLVKSLSGIDTDRLKEEKERGITVDLGFAYTALPQGGALGFVDVPGHERLVRNMLAGATGIDHVMLVVAADDGPMPQTLEHLAIVDLLGLRSGVVALTKCDTVSAERVDAVRAQLLELLAPTSLASAPILSVSNRTGEGIPALRDHLAQAAQELQALGSARRTGGFRLCIDRSFSLPGVGTVVTGTATTGTVSTGDELIVSPRGKDVRVRGLHAQNRSANEGHAGQRLALNLTGVDHHDLRRGDWVVARGLHAPSRRLDVRLRVLSSEPRALAHRTPVHLHLGAEDVSGRVLLLEGRDVAPGGSVLAQVELDRPVPALRGDRFVLRDQSAQRTIGGGNVLDVFGPDSRRRKPQRVQVLTAIERPQSADALAALLSLRLPQGVEWAPWVTLWNLPQNDAQQLLSSVPHRAITEGSKQLLFEAGHLESYADALTQTLAAHHARQPDSPGLTSESLQRTVKLKPSALVFGALVRDLLKAGALERGGPHLRLAGHAASLQGPDKQLWERIKPWLDEAGMQAPKLSDLLLRDRSLRRDQVLRMLQRLERMGQVHAVGSEYYIQTRHMLALAKVSQQLAKRDPNQRLNVKELRDATGMSRHLSVPLVEYFDKIGFTKRDEVGRHVKRDPERMFGEGG